VSGCAHRISGVEIALAIVSWIPGQDTLAELRDACDTSEPWLKRVIAHRQKSDFTYLPVLDISAMRRPRSGVKFTTHADVGRNACGHSFGWSFPAAEPPEAHENTGLPWSSTTMTSWSPSTNIAALLTLEDIQKPELLSDPAHETPLLKLSADGNAKGYDALCIPITTDKWRSRWRDMCLLATGDDRDTATMAAERRAEEWREKPAFLQDEVTLTRLGEWSNPCAHANARS
jgi:hypothetical protein